MNLYRNLQILWGQHPTPPDGWLQLSGVKIAKSPLYFTLFFPGDKQDYAVYEDNGVAPELEPARRKIRDFLLTQGFERTGM